MDRRWMRGLFAQLWGGEIYGRRHGMSFAVISTKSTARTGKCTEVIMLSRHFMEGNWVIEGKIPSHIVIEGGRRLCFHICLSVCGQDIWKGYRWIQMKLGGQVGSVIYILCSLWLLGCIISWGVWQCSWCSAPVTSKLVLILPTSEGWQAESTLPGVNSTQDSGLNSRP